MRKNLYITWAEHASGKSAIVLSALTVMLGQEAKVGIFRPIIGTSMDDDILISLVRSRFQLDSIAIGCSMQQAQEYIKHGEYENLIKHILQQYKVLEASCDVVLCIGTDYMLQSGSLEFEFNVDMAKNLNAFMLPIIKGHGKTAYEIINSIRSMKYTLQNADVSVLAYIVNRVDKEMLDEVRKTYTPEPLYVIENDETLAYASVGDIANALDAELIYGAKELLSRDVVNFKIAAMRLPNFLEHMQKGDMIITPSDRVDIILGALLSFPSTAYEEIAAILLTGNEAIPSSIKHLIDGLRRIDVPILHVTDDTFSTAKRVSQIEVRCHPKNSSKINRALGLVERSIDFEYLKKRLFDTTQHKVVTPIMFEYELLHRAKNNKKHIVLPEGEEARTLKAVEILLLRDVVDITLLGNKDKIEARIKALNLDLQGINIVDPQLSELRKKFAQEFSRLRAHKSVTFEHAYDNMENVSYFGTMYVHLGYADGMVSGAVHTTQETVRPALQIIKTKPEASIVSSVFLMCLKDRVLVYGDCAINPNPSAEELCDIAISSAQTAQQFGLDVRVAMLSYSTGSSAKGNMVEKVTQATSLAQEKAPQLLLEGPMQYDAAIDMSVAKTKLPNSHVAGNATVFIFPDLNTGNNTYKAVQRSAGALAIGPILQGLKKPINDLSRGCLVEDIVNTIAITAIQAQESTSL